MIVKGNRKHRIYKESKLIPGSGKRSQTPVTEMELREVVRAAMEAGMSYGKYVALHSPRTEDAPPAGGQGKKQRKTAKGGGKTP